MGNQKLSSMVSRRIFEPELPMTKVPVLDYFRNTNTNPKKKEKEQILAHLKEIGETEASHIRIVNWFNQRRRREKKRQPRPLLIPAPDSKEGKWMDVRHETRKSLIAPSIIIQPSYSHANLRPLALQFGRRSQEIPWLTSRGSVMPTKVTPIRSPTTVGRKALMQCPCMSACGASSIVPSSVARRDQWLLR